LDSLS
jgi:hypothetical protein